MQCFQVMAKVLQELYSQMNGPDSTKDALIQDKIHYLRNQYRNLLSGISIDYSDPATRFAYIYTYTAAHASYVAEIISFHPILSQLFQRTSILPVTCLGGGPGSDLVGIIKYMEQSENHCRINCWIVDKHQVWSDSWSELFNEVECGPAGGATNFATIDVTSNENIPLIKYLQADLFTVIYFLSEIYGFKNQSETYLTHVFTSMKSGAVILFVDNNDSRFYNWFDNMMAQNHIEVVYKYEGNIQMPSEEEKTNLGVFWQKFGATGIGNPKLGADVAIRIGKKS